MFDFIVKDLVEPSKKLAKMVNDRENEEEESKKDNTAENETDSRKSVENDDKLIDVNETASSNVGDASINK